MFSYTCRLHKLLTLDFRSGECFFFGCTRTAPHFSEIPSNPFAPEELLLLLKCQNQELGWHRSGTKNSLFILTLGVSFLHRNTQSFKKMTKNPVLDVQHSWLLLSQPNSFLFAEFYRMSWLTLFIFHRKRKARLQCRGRHDVAFLEGHTQFCIVTYLYMYAKHPAGES